MKEIQKDENVSVAEGSYVLRGESTTPEKLTARDGGPVVEPILTLLRGMTMTGAVTGKAGGSLACVRLVLRPGKVQGQGGLLTVLPDAEILSYA